MRSSDHDTSHQNGVSGRGVVSKQAGIDMKGFNQGFKSWPEAGELNPPLLAADRFVDLQYLRAAGMMK